jgi:PAS domain-containing protein
VTSQAEASAGGRLRQLIAQLSDGVLVIDRDGCLVFLNPAAEHLLGRPSADLLGEHVGLPPVAGAPAVEIELVTSDGSERVAEMRIAEVEWDGQPAFVASLRDVTEHKRLEERYRRASQTLEAIVEASPLPVVQLGPDFSVNFWNAAADELFTDSHQLSRGMPLPIARDAQNQELFRAPQRLGRGENRVRVEAVYTRGDEPLQLAVFI